MGRYFLTEKSPPIAQLVEQIPLKDKVVGSIPTGRTKSFVIAQHRPLCHTTFMVVRMRATRSHRNNRRSHHALSAGRVSVCQNCKAKHQSHRVCMNCGWYNGRQVIDLAAKAAAKAKK